MSNNKLKEEHSSLNTSLFLISHTNQKLSNMHGLVYEIFEEWVLEQQGIQAWHAIKEKAGCDVQDQAFVTRTFYSYDSWVDLVTATADVLGSSFDSILEEYGHYNIRYHFTHGYDALLKCQGSTLRQWLSNLNAMHDHIQKSFPGGNFCPPVFWCEDSDSDEGDVDDGDVIQGS